MQGGFSNASSAPTGPPGAGNSYVPPPPPGFALAPSRGRPPSGPRASVPGPTGSGGLSRRPPGTLDSSGNGTGNGKSNGSGQAGLPY